MDNPRKIAESLVLEKFLISLLAGFVLLACLLGFIEYLNTPTMHKSYSNDACISVDSEIFTCKNPPSKYHTVWVN